MSRKKKICANCFWWKDPEYETTKGYGYCVRKCPIFKKDKNENSLGAYCYPMTKIKYSCKHFLDREE